MRRIFFIWAYFLFILFGQENPIQSFYDLINQGHTIKMNVEFLQKQYDNSFGAEGSFYLIGKKKYIFDSNFILFLSWVYFFALSIKVVAYAGSNNSFSCALLITCISDFVSITPEFTRKVKTALVCMPRSEFQLDVPVAICVCVVLNC